jgi:hypothetical protein
MHAPFRPLKVADPEQIPKMLLVDQADPRPRHAGAACNSGGADAIRKQRLLPRRLRAARHAVGPGGIAVLLDAQRRLDANPLAALVQIGLTYGIDLRPALQASGMIAQGGERGQAAQASPWNNDALRSMHDRSSKATAAEPRNSQPTIWSL